MDFNCYATEIVDMKRYLVSGGGLDNGNACAYVDVIYAGNEIEVWYVEYGKDNKRILIGDDIEFDEEGFSFKVLCDGNYVDNNGNVVEDDKEE